MQRITITFTGTVQGVGFRYTTVTIAKRLAVSGWIRNETDGSVKCVVEGEDDEVRRFIEQIQAQMGGSIRETRIDSSPASGEFHGFAIRH